MLTQQSSSTCLESCERTKDTSLVNADCTIIAQKPKMAPYIEPNERKIAEFIRDNARKY